VPPIQGRGKEKRRRVWGRVFNCWELGKARVSQLSGVIGKERQLEGRKKENHQQVAEGVVKRGVYSEILCSGHAVKMGKSSGRWTREKLRRKKPKQPNKPPKKTNTGEEA